MKKRVVVADEPERTIQLRLERYDDNSIELREYDPNDPENDWVIARIDETGIRLLAGYAGQLPVEDDATGYVRITHY